MKPDRRLAAGVARAMLLVMLIVGCSLATIFGELGQIMTITPYLVYAAIGALLTTRQSHNPIGWLFLAIGSITGLNAALYAITESAAGTPHANAWYVLLVAWAYNFVWLIVLSLSTVFTLLLFPNGLLSPRWRPVLWAAAGSTVVGVVLASVAPDLIVGNATYANPLHRGEWSPLLSGAFTVAIVVLLACGVLSVISAVLRYRRAHGVERLQMQWFAFAAVMFAAILVLSGRWSGHPGVSDLLFTLGACLIPLSCGIAILRYRLYDLGRIVRRTTSYAMVTGLLIATYAIVVTTVSRLLPESGTLAVAGATLAVAAVARPLLRRVQDAIDRRFNRSRYDARDTVDDFSTQVERQIDTDTLVSGLLETVDHALQPTRSALWIKSPN